MGQQSNKIQKRRRRLDYLERKALKAKEAAVASPRPKLARKAAPAKKEKAPAPERTEGTTETAGSAAGPQSPSPIAEMPAAGQAE